MSTADKLRYVQEKEAYDEKKRKEEVAEGDEEIKQNQKCKDGKRVRESSSKNQDKNGYKRPKHELVFNVSDEKEVRLKDIIGHDQISWPSDSEELAAYSPPGSNNGRVRSMIGSVQPRQEIAQNDAENGNQSHNHEIVVPKFG